MAMSKWSADAVPRQGRENSSLERSARRLIAIVCTCLAAALSLLPVAAFAQDFTPEPNAWVDEDGVLHWDAEGEYLSRIDLSPLMFGPDSANYCAPSVNGEYTYDIENLFQMAEQFYGGIGTGDVSGLNSKHPVTFVYYEKQADDTMKEVGKAVGTYSYPYKTGQLVTLDTPSQLTWTGDGFTASWDAVDNAANYQVTFYETTASGSTSEVGETTTANTSCELTSVVTSPKDGVTYSFEVRARGPEGNFEYRASDTSKKSVPSGVWKTPVVEYGLSVGGVDVTSENAMDVLGNGSVSYDPDSQTLTLENATIAAGMDGSYGAIKRVAYDGPDSLTIELVGTNSCGSIVIGGNTDDPCPLTITGEGSLTVSETEPAGAISAQGDITVDGATLTVTAYVNGIQANSSSIAIKNGAKVDASATGDNAYMALSAGDDVEVTGAGTRLVASTEDADGYYAVIAHDGAVTIGEGAYVEAHGVVRSQQQLTVKGEGTVLQAEGTTSGKSAVSCPASISVEGGAQVKATGRCYGATGISVTNGSMLDVTAVGDGFAVDAQGPITVSDSTLKAKSTDTVAVYIWNGSGALTLANSMVDVSSENSYALYALTGGIEMSGGMVTLSAPHSYATYTTGSLVAKDGVKLDVKNSVHGLAADGTVRLSGATGTIDVDNAALFSNSAVVVIESGCDLVLVGQMTINAAADQGDISISDSELDVTGTDAVYAEQNITIDGSQVEITASENPINTGSGSLTISGDQTKITATGGSYIGAGNELVINGGAVSVDVTTPADENVMAALYGNKAVYIKGGTVNATVRKAGDNDTTYAIISNGIVEFTGGTTTLKGDTGTLYVSKNSGSVSFGNNADWYQWTTTPDGTPVRSEDEQYTYGENPSTYLRIEPAVPLYELVIVDGTGVSTVAGSYVEGAEVTISANPFDASLHFSGWTQSGTVTGSFGDANAAETTFTMPAGEVTLTANYEPHIFEGGVCTVCGAKDPDYVVTPPTRPNYPPTVTEGDGGSVSIDPERPHAGDEVTITPEPDEGKTVDSVTVTDKDGELVEVTDNGDGTWSFTQPSGKVTITVTFVCDGGELCPSAHLTDVDPGEWYHEAIDWAVESGLMSGYDDGSNTFGPDDTLTRAQLAQILYNQAGRPEVDPSAVEAYSDCSAGAWYARAVAWAASQGLMTGYDDGTGRFGPEDELTREQLAAVFWRIAGEPAADADLSAFPDGDSTSAWALEPVEWAVETGLLKGYDHTGELDPAGELTRAQAATVFFRLAGNE